MSGAKAVVTGANGFLGRHLVGALVAAGYDTHCLVRSARHCEALPGDTFTLHQTDYRSEAQLREIFTGATEVFHCAARVGTSRFSRPEFEESNIGLTEKVLSALPARCRLVYCSTIATCAVSVDGSPVTEQAPWNLADFGMNNDYTSSKREAERRVLRAVSEGVDAVVVNPCYMLGPGDSKLGSTRLLLDVCTGKIPAVPAGFNNFVDVRDVAGGMLLAAEKGERGERYILGGENLSYREFFSRVGMLTGCPQVTRPLPLWLGKLLGVVGDLKEKMSRKDALLNSSGIAWSFADCRYSSAKANSQLGYQTRGIDGAIRDTFKDFLDRGLVTVVAPQ